MPFDTLTAEEERELVLRWQQHGDLDARDKVISLNRHLIGIEIPRYADRGVDVEDLEQEGWMGLCRAMDDHDPDIARFCTHAVPWVKAKMGAAIYNQGHTVKAAIGAQKLASRYLKLKAQLGRSPTKEEICERLAISPERCEDVLAAAVARKSVSGSDIEHSARSGLSASELVERAMEDVSPNQRMVLENHWGLGGAPELSLLQIARTNKFEGWQVDVMYDRGLKKFKANYEDLVHA